MWNKLIADDVTWDKRGSIINNIIVFLRKKNTSIVYCKTIANWNN
jgi:hypothetical protein